MFWLSTFQLTTAPVGTPLQTVLLCFFKFIIIIILVSLNLWRLYYNANFLNNWLRHKIWLAICRFLNKFRNAGSEVTEAEGKSYYTLVCSLDVS